MTGREQRYEIADFHPETGHLHACTDRATCDCAAWLFCIAGDEQQAVRQTTRSTGGDVNCRTHDEPLTWEQGGTDQPTIHGRWFCPLCAEELAADLDTQP